MIYTYIQRELKGYAISLTKNIHDAEDLVQDTCLRMFLSYGDRELPEQKRLSGTIMKNLFTDWMRKYRFIEELPEVPAKDEIYDRMQQKELQKALVEMSNQKHALSFRLRIEGYSNTEIAPIIGTNRNNINQYIIHSKNHLKKTLCHSNPTMYKTPLPVNSLKTTMETPLNTTPQVRHKQQLFISQLLRARRT